MPFGRAALCYIGCMLLDSQLVPETLVKPRSFVGLMALYESNYLRLLQLVPELERLDGCFRSRVAGECELFVEILERARRATRELLARGAAAPSPTATACGGVTSRFRLQEFRVPIAPSPLSATRWKLGELMPPPKASGPPKPASSPIRE